MLSLKIYVRDDKDSIVLIQYIEKKLYRSLMLYF